MRLISEVLRLVQKPDEKTAKEDSSVLNFTVGFSAASNAVILSTSKHNVEPYIKAAAAQRRVVKIT